MKYRSIKRALVLLLTLAMLITSSGVVSFAESLNNDAVNTAAESATTEQAELVEDSSAETAAVPAATQAAPAEEKAEPKEESAPAGDEAEPAPAEEAAEPAEENAEPAAEDPAPAEKPEKAASEKPSENTADYPAFEQSKTVDGVKVSVTAEAGTFPEGATLVVRSATRAEEKKADALVEEARDADSKVAASYTFDISVVDKNGNELQPKDGKAVNVSFRTAEVADKELTTEVFHIDEAAGTAEALAVSESGKTAQVSVDGFSLYRITFAEGTKTVNTIDDEEGTVVTYEFYNGEEKVQWQDIKAGDKLYEPSVPNAATGQKFEGWYIGTEKLEFDDSGKLTIENLHADTNGVVTVNAKFSAVHYVTFYNQDGNVFSRIGVGDDGTINESDLPTFKTKKSVQKFLGWSTSEGGTTAVSFPIEHIKADAKYYPIIDEKMVVHFYANRDHFPGMAEDTDNKVPGVNVTYTAPQNVEKGGKVTKPADPVADLSDVYTFAGWYTDPECSDGSLYDWNQPVNDELNLYAKWNVGKTSYQVVIMKEKTDKHWDDASRSVLTPANYEFYESRTVSNVDVMSTVSLADDAPEYTTDEGFEVLDYGKPKAKKVLPDGSTTLYVYWNREVRTTNFYRLTDPTNTSSGTSGRYSTRTLYRQIIGLYEQTFSNAGVEWPLEYKWYNKGGYYSAINAWGPDGSSIALRECFNDNLSSEYYSGSNDTQGTYNIYHVKQNADGSWDKSGAIQLKNTYGSLTLRDIFPNFKVTAWSQNYQANERNRTAASDGTKINVANNIYIYHAREKYNITFYEDATTPLQSYDIYYEGSLPGAVPTITPDDNLTTFAGWSPMYGDTNAQNAVDFTDFKMSDHNIRLYPILVKDAINVVLVKGADDVEMHGSDSYWPTIGSTIDTTNMDHATRPDYELDGWYTNAGERWDEGHAAVLQYCDKDEGGQYVTRDDPTYGNTVYTITLTARWTPAAQAPVGYAVGDGSGSISDDSIYVLNGQIKVSNEIPTAPEGKIFIGWKDILGNIHLPGETFTFNTNDLLGTVAGENCILLTAVYANEGVPTATITYNANYPDGAENTDDSSITSEAFAFNAKTKLLGVDAFSYDGYVLDGWSKTEDGDVDYELGEDVLVDNVGENVLYGHWDTHVHNWTYTADGAVITAHCDKTGHTSGDKTVTLTEPANKTYTGEAIEATFTVADGFPMPEGDSAAISYAKGETAMTGKPVDVGTYTASVTIGGAPASVTYEITKNGTNAFTDGEGGKPAAPTIAGWNYDGKSAADEEHAHAVSGPDGNKFGTVTYVYEKYDDSTKSWSEVQASDVKDAGEYRVKAVVAETGNYNGIESAYTEFTISKADPVVTEPAAKTGLVYNKSEQDLVTAGTTADGIIKYSIDGGTTWTTEVPKATDKGDYTVYWYVEGDKNHNDYGTADAPKGPVNVSIAAATAAEADFANAKPTATHPTYQAGTPQALANEPARNNVPEGYTVKYRITEPEGSATDWSKDIPTATEVGDYTIEYMYDGGANYKSVTPADNSFTSSIGKADPTVTAPAAKADLVYNGNNQELVTRASTNGGTVYYRVNSGEWTTDVPEAKNQGTYTVEYYVKGDGSYTDKGSKTSPAESVQVTVAKRTITVSGGITANDKTYDGTNSAELVCTGATLEGKVAGDDLSVTATGTFADANAGENKDVNITGLTLTGAAADNYQLAASGNQDKATASINAKTLTGDNKATIELTLPDDGYYTYDGTEHKPVVVVKDGYTVIPDTEYDVTYTNNKDAGTATVTIKFKGNYAGSDDVSETFVIAKKPITAVADDKSSAYKQPLAKLTYTLEDSQLAAGDSKDGIKITLTSDADSDAAAGSTFDITGTQGEGSDPNYTVTVTKGTYTISKAEATVTVRGFEGEYDGQPHGITVEVKDNNVSPVIDLLQQMFGTGNEATVYYSTTKALTADNYTTGTTTAPSFTDFTNGEKTVYYYVDLKNYTSGGADGVSGSQTVNITKSETTEAALADNQKPSANTGLTYNGEAQALVKKPTAEIEGYTVKYSTDGGNTWTTEAPEAKDAGDDYTVKVRYEGDANHESFDGADIQVSIAQKEVGLTWSNTELTYNGSAQAPTATATELCGTDTCTVTVEGAQTAAGNYTATATGLSNSNYKLPEEVTTAFEIKQDKLNTAGLTANQKPAPQTGLTYSGEPQTLVAAPSEIPAGYTGVKYSTDGGNTWTESPQGTDAGPYTVKVKYVGDANHEDVAGDDILVSIGKKTLTVKWPEQTELTYTGEDQTFEASVTGIVEADKEDVTISYSDNTGKDAADHTATVSISGDRAGNYEIASADDSKAWSIKAAASAVSAPTAKEGLAYTGSDQELINAGSLGANDNSTIKYYLAESAQEPEKTASGWTDDASDVKAKDAGTYYVYYYVDGDENHSDSDVIGPVVVTIGEMAAPSVSDIADGNKPAANSGLVYNTAPQALVTNPVTKPDGYDTVQYKQADGNWSTAVPTGTDAGDYTVEYRFTDSTGNHAATAAGSVSVNIAKLNIAGATVTVTPASQIYDGTGKTAETVEVKVGNITVPDDQFGVEHTHNVNVGTANVFAKANANSTNFTGVATGTFAITAATVASDDITVTFPSGDKAPVYDGTEKHPEPEVTVTVPDPADPTKTKELVLVYGTDFTVEYPAESTNAGSYEAKIVLRGNYSGEKDDQQYTIAKRPLTVSIEDQTITYGGSIDQTKYTAGEPADGQTVTVALAQSTANATNGTPGEITATVTVKAGDNDVTDNYEITAAPAALTIDRASLDPENMPEGSEPSVNKLDGNKDLVYTGAAQDLVKAPEASKVPEGYKLQYKLADDAEDKWSDSVPQATNAGSYDVVYKYVPTDSNHAEVTDDSFKLTVPIEKADLSGDGVVISLDPASAVFNGSEHEPAVTVTLNGVTLPDGDYTVSYSNNTNKGTATVTVTATADGNCVKSNSTTFNIDAKPLAQDDVTVTFPSGEDSPVYDGTSKTPDPVVVVNGKELVKGTDYDVVYPADTVNAGEKTAQIVFKGDYINATDPESGESQPVTGTYTVQKAPLTITAKDQTITTDNKFKTGVDQVTTGQNQLKNGDTLTEITLTCNNPSADTEPTATAQTGTITPGNAKIMNGNKDVTENYEITYSTEGKITIKGKQDAPTADEVKDLVKDQETTSITINTKPGYEYVLTTSPEAPAAEDWTAAVPADKYYKENGTAAGTHTFEDLTVGTQYYVHARKAATEDNNPSPATTVPTSTRPDAPANAADCVTVGYVAETLTAKEGYEIFDPAADNGNGAWVTAVNDFTPGGGYQVRIAAKDGVAPSGGTGYTAPARGDAPAKVAEKDIDKSDVTLTVHNTDKDQEYIVVKKGTEPTKADWATAQKGNGSDLTDLTFTTDSDGEPLTEGTEYEVITRTSAVEGSSLASNPSAPAEVKTKNSTDPLTDDEKKDLQDDTWSEDTAEPNSITVKGTDGYEYLVVPKGTPADAIDWSKAAKCPDDFTDGVKVYTKDSNGDPITENIDYEIIARKAETDTDMPSEPETVDAYTTKPAPADGVGHKENYPDELIEVEDGYEIRVVSPEGTEPSTWTEGDPSLGEEGKKYVPLVPGATYEIRKKADSPDQGDHESEPTSFTTAERPDAPEKVEESDVSKKDTSITVNPTDEDQEYIVLPVKEDGTGYKPEELEKAWEKAKDGNGGALTFDEDANGDPIAPETEYVVYNRVKATDSTPHSDPAVSDPITTKASQEAPTDEEIKDIVDDQKDTSITVNTEPGYEYIVTTSPDAPTADDWSTTPSNGYYKEEGDEPGTHTFDGLQPGTQYYVHVRKAETDEPAPGKAASPANTVPTETRHSTPDPVDPDDVKAETKKSEDGKDTSSITIDPTEPGNEYIVVPKGTDPSDYDWSEGQKSENGEPITFDGLTPGKDYEIITRKAATDPGKESEPSKPTTVTTPKAEQDAPQKPNVRPNGKTSVIVQPARSGEEYSIDGGKTWVRPAEGSDTVVFNGLKPGTSYNVIARLAETDTQKASAPSEPASAKTDDEKVAKAEKKAKKKAAGNDNAAAGVTAAPAVEAPAEEPAEEIADETVPKVDNAPAGEEPEAEEPKDDWALFDFILTALTVLGAAMALRRRRYDDDEESAKKSRNAKIAGFIAAAASVITLILTQDISGAMTLFDGWSVPIAAFFGGQIVSAVLNKKYTDSEE